MRGTKRIGRSPTAIKLREAALAWVKQGYTMIPKHPFEGPDTEDRAGAQVDLGLQEAARVFAVKHPVESSRKKGKR